MSEVVSKFLMGLTRRQRGVRHLLLRLSVSLFALSLTQPSHAQPNTWKLVKQFDRSIGCGYFFDKDHGLIGSGIRPGLIYDFGLGYAVPYPGDTVAIYRTTDGGLTWSASQLPRPITGAVTAIAMIDSLEGYASIFSDYSYDYFGTFGHSCLWHTTDGGLSWVDNLHLDHIATCVYAQHGLLMFTKWDVPYQMHNDSAWFYYPLLDSLGGQYSYNNGLTWTGNFRRGNGIAFADSLHGVVSEMNADSGGANFWSTSDAGRTWLATNTQYESWSVFAMPGTSMFFCANESQPGLPHKSVNWSTDGGQTWSTRAFFPAIHFTGTINGAGKTLYLQTDSGSAYYYNYFYNDPSTYQYGLYRSDDLGATWHWVGGPSNSRDSRFVVTGCEGEVVYAFDGMGGVWKTIDGGDGTLAPRFTFSVDSLSLTPNPCGDTIAFDVIGASCNPIFVDSASVLLGSELSTLNRDAFPVSLAQDDSSELRLLYTPSRSGETVSLIRVWGHAGSRLVKRDITIRLFNNQPSSLSLSRDTSNLEAGTCGIALDTVYLTNIGCPGMTLDSVVIPKGEITIVNQFPATVPNNDSLPLCFIFEPDSARSDLTTARVYAHNGSRIYDTVITITSKSVWQSLNFKLDSAYLQFTTRHCKPLSVSLKLSTTSCDSVAIDSVVSTNTSFSVAHSSVIPARMEDSLLVLWQPDSSGPTAGTIHIFAHDRQRVFDTAISVSGINNSLPQALTLSQTVVNLNTKSCQSLRDSIVVSNQGCETLYFDSVTAAPGELAASYDTMKSPLFPDDSLHVRLIYLPSDGNSKTESLHLFMHTASRTIDTTITLSLSNSIPAQPLALSADSFYLFTKYCQPVSTPFAISNFGCQDFVIDSLIVLGDLRGEFRVATISDSVKSEQQMNSTLMFAPDTAGERFVKVRMYGHSGSSYVDTMLSLVGKNLTAPVPYVGSISGASAGSSVLIPIMLEPTTDTFSIRNYSFHLAFNTNLLTPAGLQFSGTCSQTILSSSWSQDASGISGHVTLGSVISGGSELSKPLVYVIAMVSLTSDTATSVSLDTFITDVTGQLPIQPLCSIPSQPFSIALQCGDPLLLQVLRSQSPSIDFISVMPNPVNTNGWTIGYLIKKPLDNLVLRVYSSDGKEVYHKEGIPSSAGAFQCQFPTPSMEGDYFIVLDAGGEKCGQKGSVVR